MFHASDFIAVWPRGRPDGSGPRKTLAFRDFYEVDGVRLGEVQSTGMTAGYGNVLFALRSMFDRSVLGRFPWLRHGLRIPAYVGARLLGAATVFATIVEDHPMEGNRVLLDPASPGGFRFVYMIDDDLTERVQAMRRHLKQALGEVFVLPLNQDVSLNFGHPCGTCVSGMVPESSVVDPEGRAHGLQNLYVADASYMPTSGGTNPGLTIAAIGLRVGAVLSERLRRG
jgi:hypothetical protein